MTQWPEFLATLTRQYPFYSGCGTIANHRLMNVIAPINSDLIWAHSPGGQMLVPPNDHVGRSIYFFGDLDPKITWIIGRLVKPGDHVLDIGANIGLLTLWMSKLVGTQGTVQSFEPNPRVNEILVRTLERNNVTNVRLHAVALGASEGEMTLNVPGGNLGSASLVRSAASAIQTHLVHVMKLDDLIFRKPPSRIAVMKIDVEGFEFEVFSGAHRVLKEIRPDAILFESNEHGSHEQITPVMQLLQEHDYEMLMIPTCLVRMRTKIFDVDGPREIQGHDFVAAPRGDTFAKICQLLRAEK